MPRRAKEERTRNRGYFYFDARKVSKQLSISELLDMLFSGVPRYREFASFIVNSLRFRASEAGRSNPYWITASEMSSMIEEGLGKSKKPMAYKVLYEFLIPYGIIRKEESERRYYLSKDFSLALRKISESYERWLSGRPSVPRHSFCLNPSDAVYLGKGLLQWVSPSLGLLWHHNEYPEALQAKGYLFYLSPTNSVTRRKRSLQALCHALDVNLIAFWVYAHDCQYFFFAHLCSLTDL